MKAGGYRARMEIVSVSTAANVQSMPWVIFLIADNYYAISSAYVREMVLKPNINEVPGLPSQYLGVTNLRGRVIPVLSMRRFFGHDLIADQMDDLLSKREQDHIRWLNELEACVRENREFKLTTDPHQCAFGKWYDAYRTENRVIGRLLAQFDTPHQAIHGVGKKVAELMKAHRQEEAAATIERTKVKELATMIRLFGALRDAFRHDMREIVLVAEVGGKTIGGVVDAVDSVEYLDETSQEVPPSLACADLDFFTAVGRRKRDGSLVMMLDAERLFGQSGATCAA